MIFSRQISQGNRIQEKAELTVKLLGLLKRCKSIRPLQQIQTQMLIHSINKPNFLLVKLIELKDFDRSRHLFAHLEFPNDYAFNVFIRGLTNTWKKFDLALKFYYKMKSVGVKPDNFTYPFVFISCANLSACYVGKLVHCEVLKNGLSVDFHVSHSLITMYSKCRELGYARKVFDEIDHRDTVSWNSMISGYSKRGFPGEAVQLFRNMRDEGFIPDEMTLVSVLGACGDLGNLEMGKWVEKYLVENHMELNFYTGSALVDMYAKCGKLESARKIFDNLPNKDVVTWNAMITGYAQNGCSDEAISLHNAMKVAGISPDKITVIEVLSACASIGALDLGKQIEEYALQTGINNDIYVATALIDMYAKCGNIDHAFLVFKNFPNKNEVTWNAMISAFAFHGRAQDALSLFQCMLRHDSSAPSPNDVTFVAALSACVHVGLVSEGRRLFDLMTSSFELVPKIEHYSCMVDLFSRAGRVYEAWDFINKMPRKPDEVLLGALLGSCHKVKNVEVAELVLKLLLELEPSNSVNYVISSKIYANESRWDDSAKMRLLMKQKGVTKTPGCSWIEEMGTQKLLKFHAGELLDPTMEAIRQVLDFMYEDMVVESCVSNFHQLLC